MSRLLNTKDGQQKVFCFYCMTGFQVKNNGKERLAEHEKLCSNNDPVRVKIPRDEDGWMEYDQFQYECPLPVCGYADFESIPIKCSSKEENCPADSFTVVRNGKKMSTIFRLEGRYGLLPFK